MAITVEQVLKMARWSEPRELQTKFGPRIFRRATPTGEFSAAWKTNKDEIKALGAGFSKDRDGEWELSWWQPLPDEVKAARAESVAASKATDAEIDLPRPDGLNYMPFQKAGIRFGLLHKNVLIADEMGLGKTIQAIGIINADPQIDTALVVCPKSLKLNWYRELKKWLTRPLTVGVVNGGWPNTQVVIINYEGLAKFATQTGARTWGVVIVDEAHYIKSKKAQRSVNVKAIKSVRKVRMTGTPICNRPVELWNLIEDLEPAAFGNFWQFAKRYANAQSNGFGWDFSGASNLDELQRRLRELVMVRRLKADVLTELPRKIRQVVEIEAETAEQRRMVRREQEHEAASEERLAELRARAELSKAESDEAYKLAIDLLQDTASVDFQEMSKIRHETALSKVDAVVTHVEQCLEDNDNKIVIAAHHRDVVDELMSGLAQYHPVMLMGGMSEQARQASVDTFQKDSRCRVFVGGIMAAGVGITLTASSHVVFAELDWVPGNVTQFEDRCHRIGQTQTVLVQHIVLQDSIDARMAKMIIEKQSVIDSALDVNHPERQAPVWKPRTAAVTDGTSRVEIEKEAEEISREEIADLLAKLRVVAGMDEDHAADLNGVGFSKIDVMIGHSLASQMWLTPKQAVIARKLVNRYRRQLGE